MNILLEGIFIILINIILIPVAIVVTTPFILILSFWGKYSYFKNASLAYKKVILWIFRIMPII